MTGRTDRPVEVLDQPALAPLWREVHHRLGSGRAVARVRVDVLSDDGRVALADLLGTARYPDGPVALARLDAAVGEITGLDTRGLVEHLLGPVEDRAARRADAATAREDLWAWLRAHPVVRARPALGDWVAALRRGGVDSVDEARLLFGRALDVVERLPAEGVPLPTFAADVVRDPHGLDDGARLTGVVLRAVAAMLGTDPPANAELRRELWERVGINEDQLSSTVLVAGMRPSGGSLPAVLLQTCAEAGAAAALTLAQIRATDDLRLTVPTAVHVVENPSVLAMAVHRFGPRCPPLVCIEGWPSGAAIRLLRMVAGHHPVRYHGDLDGEGVRIAAYVCAKVGARPWRMTTGDYLADVPASGPPVGRITDAPWDPQLAAAMGRRGVALVEERVAATLLDDLDGAEARALSRPAPVPGDAPAGPGS